MINLSLIKKLLEIKYVRFFLVGGSGIFLNLLITGLFAYFVFSEAYFYLASIIGTTVNILYNFYLHTKFTFKTKKRHGIRFTGFTTYTLVLASIQETIIAYYTPVIGIEYLIVFKGFVVLVFSIVTFLFFNYFLFKTSES